MSFVRKAAFSKGILFCVLSTLLLIPDLSASAFLCRTSLRCSSFCRPLKQLHNSLPLRRQSDCFMLVNLESKLIRNKLSILPFRRRKLSIPSPSGTTLGFLRRRHAILRRKRLRKKELGATSRYLRSLRVGKNITDDNGIAKLKQDEDFITAVKEVKGAAQNMTMSAEKFTVTIASNVPDILRIILSAVVSKQIRNDIKQRKQYYISDWTDAFQNKRQCIPAILFLYFACLAPIVSFGTISSQITEGAIGVLEFFLASGGAGMAYAMFSGQPMAFIAPTGLTLAFISGLFRFCSLRNIPFFPVYTWVGLWTGFFLIVLGVQGASRLIRFCTRFTDDVFNGLLSFNFIYEAFSSLRRNFLLADPMNLSMPFISLSIALGTFWSTMMIIAIQTTIYFNERFRQLAKDFGPVAIIFGFSALNNMHWLKKFQVPTLAVPNAFQLAGLVPFTTVSLRTKILCSFPALLLTSLFFMDQNISVRVVNNPSNKLKKGAAYNLDMVTLGAITAVLSVFGLPWMCGATVQSMNHVRALTKMKVNDQSEVEVDNVVETRTTGFVIHAMIAGTIKLLPMLIYLPIPVVSGVFLFLGRKLMTGNRFLRRIFDAFAEKKRLGSDHPIQVLGRKKMNLFTGIQLLCLWVLWNFKQNSATAIFFPSVIVVLMGIRSFLLPRFFSERELEALGDPTPR